MSKLREAARGILLAVETVVLLIGDGLGALVEALDQPERDKRPAPQWMVDLVAANQPAPHGPYTIADLKTLSRKRFEPPYVKVHSDGCSKDGCVPGCKVMHERAIELAHAGYGNIDLIEDNEATRAAEIRKREKAGDPLGEVLRVGKAFLDQLPAEMLMPEAACGAFQPEKYYVPLQRIPYRCTRTGAHDEHRAEVAEDGRCHILAAWPVEQ